MYIYEWFIDVSSGLVTLDESQQHDCISKLKKYLFTGSKSSELKMLVEGSKSFNPLLFPYI